MPRALADPEAPGGVRREWNTLTTLASGAVGRIDGGGTIFPAGASFAVELWIGTGERWVHAASESSVRQQRVAGLPVVETRVRVGADDVVWTAWADDAGGRGRIVVDVRSELDTPVALAVAVRPFALVGSGSIGRIEIDGTDVVVDGTAAVRLPTPPGDVVVGDRVVGDCSDRLGDDLRRDDAIESPDSTATLAAVLPLTPGPGRRIEIGFLGARAPESADAVVAGWRRHLSDSAELSLPGWPDHLPASLLAGLLGASVVDPAGDPVGHRDLTALVSAAAAVGLTDEACATASGQLARAEIDVAETELPLVAATAAAVRDLSGGAELIVRHREVVARAVGAALSRGSVGADRRPLLDTVTLAAGARARADASTIVGVAPDPRELADLAVAGVELDDAGWREVATATGETHPRSPAALSLAMMCRARGFGGTDPLVSVRALAGGTWRWPSTVDDTGVPIGSGDSPHARAALLNGLRAIVVRPREGGVDLLPHVDPLWYGRDLEVRRIRTPSATVSFAVRWHGERPALLWELDSTGPTEIRCGLDPAFVTTEASGETLLGVPPTAPPRRDLR